VIVVTQYLLTLYRDYAVPIPPERSRQVRAAVNALGDKMTDAGAFVFKGRLARRRGGGNRPDAIRDAAPGAQ
jgi:hypothetical protein